MHERNDRAPSHNHGRCAEALPVVDTTLLPGEQGHAAVTPQQCSWRIDGITSHEFVVALRLFQTLLSPVCRPQTIVPACEGSDIFLSGALHTLPSGIAADSPATSNDSVVWTATFAASDASVSFAW